MIIVEVLVNISAAELKISSQLVPSLVLTVNYGLYWARVVHSASYEEGRRGDRRDCQSDLYRIARRCLRSTVVV